MIHVLTAVSVVNTVIDRWRAIIQLLNEEVPTRGLLGQSALEVLQLTQEIEVWGYGGPTLFHKPYEGTDRRQVKTTGLLQLTYRLWLIFYTTVWSDSSYLFLL